MDGDLQHPPELLGELLRPVAGRHTDLAVATRYRHPGATEGLDGIHRRAVSALCRRAAHRLVPRSRAVDDPLGGYFAFRRAVLEEVDLRPAGFKILLEILARGNWTTAIDVPYIFGHRTAGESNASLATGLAFGRQLWGLRRSR